MRFRDLPIRRKLRRIVFLMSGIVLIITCTAFFVYEFYAFRNAAIKNLSTIGKIIAANSTAALAFEDYEAGKEILAALKSEPHIVMAALYDKNGNLFCTYSTLSVADTLPRRPKQNTYYFKSAYLEGFERVNLEAKYLGTLYLKSNLDAMYERLRVYGTVVLLVVVLSLGVGYFATGIASRILSRPLLKLTRAASNIAAGNYVLPSLDGLKSNDEVGTLAEVFTLMSERISRSERELQTLNNNLEALVEQRTHELRTVNQELESFTYSVSHDLRAPLRAINGYAQIINEDYGHVLDQEATRLLNNIKNNAQNMGVLIDDLLAFSKLGRQEVKKTKTNITELVQDVIHEIDSNTKHKAIIHVKPLEPASIDRNLIKQVWMNLILNAVKYSGRKEKPEIEIGSTPSDAGITYYIKDNGAGFNMQYADKLFGVFQRLHNPNEFEGTGIGLAIVKRIVTKHGGKVWAESVYGDGATFYFSLPG